MPGLVRQSTPSVVTWRSILLILLALPGLVSCGTFQASLEVENTMRGPEFTEAPGYVFAENAIFLGYRISELQVEPGGELDLELHWELDEAPAYPYTIGIRLVSEREAPPAWQYSDSSIPWREGYQVTKHQLRFSPQIRSGHYGVEIWLQHPETGAREPVMGPQGAVADRVVPLMTLQITDDAIHDTRPLSSPDPDLVPVATSVFTSTPSSK